MVTSNDFNLSRRYQHYQQQQQEQMMDEISLDDNVLTTIPTSKIFYEGKRPYTPTDKPVSQSVVVAEAPREPRELSFEPMAPTRPTSSFTALGDSGEEIEDFLGLGCIWRPFHVLNSLFAAAQKPPQVGGVLGITDAESDTQFEISLESIEVNFKEDYIGGGNQSSVFRGRWQGRYIALKKLNRASEVNIKRLAALNHPNVIKTLGVCTKDIYPCIVMEYCEKGGLFDVLRRQFVSKSLFLRWTREISDGMNYLHSLKIVHRDLKSPNILVDEKDALKICDFGSLYAWEKSQPMPSVFMSVCGTSQWMSPEMMKNEPCSEKVDIWSYGVVVWECLTGEVPYKNISPMAIMYGVGSGKLRLHVPKTTPDTVALLLKLCWAKRPRNRPSFATILSHLANLKVELSAMSDDAWKMRKGVWNREIQDENLRQNSYGADAADVDVKNQKAEELVKKRMHELRHAQEIRQMYDFKYRRVNKMMKKILLFLEEIRARETELDRREMQLNEAFSRLQTECQQHEQKQQKKCQCKHQKQQQPVILLVRNPNHHSETTSSINSIDSNNVVLSQKIEENFTSTSKFIEDQTISRQQNKLFPPSSTSSNGANIINIKANPVMLNEEEGNSEKFPSENTFSAKTEKRPRPTFLQMVSPTAALLCSRVADNDDCSTTPLNEQPSPPAIDEDYEEDDEAEDLDDEDVNEDNDEKCCRHFFYSTDHRNIDNNSTVCWEGASSPRQPNNDTNNNNNERNGLNFSRRRAKFQFEKIASTALTGNLTGKFDGSNNNNSKNNNNGKKKKNSLAFYHPKKNLLLVQQSSSQSVPNSVVGEQDVYHIEFQPKQQRQQHENSIEIENYNSVAGRTTGDNNHNRQLHYYHQYYQQQKLDDDNKYSNNNNINRKSRGKQQLQQFFTRNSFARVSGLSADSGVCPELDNSIQSLAFVDDGSLLSVTQPEDLQLGVVADDGNAVSCACGGGLAMSSQDIHQTPTVEISNQPPLCRNSFVRWSDSRIQNRRNRNSTTLEGNTFFSSCGPTVRCRRHFNRRETGAVNNSFCYFSNSKQANSAKEEKAMTKNATFENHLESHQISSCSSSSKTTIISIGCGGDTYVQKSTKYPKKGDSENRQNKTTAEYMKNEDDSISSLCRDDKNRRFSLTVDDPFVKNSLQTGFSLAHHSLESRPKPKPRKMAANAQRKQIHSKKHQKSYLNQSPLEQRQLSVPNLIHQINGLDFLGEHKANERRSADPVPSSSLSSRNKSVSKPIPFNFNRQNRAVHHQTPESSPTSRIFRDDKAALSSPASDVAGHPLPSPLTPVRCCCSLSIDGGRGLEGLGCSIAADLEAGLPSTTIVSSLERALEIAVNHPDGLSDKESKLRAAKSSFNYSHRRTASNPINMSKQMPFFTQALDETSTTTESENEVYV